MEQLIVLGIAWLLLSRWFWRGAGGRRHLRYGMAEPRFAGCGGRAERYGSVGSRCGSRRAERVAAGRTVAGEAARPPTDAGRRQASLAPENAVSQLQQDWIHGRISDREYEAGLDAVYGSPTNRSS